jgi:hypothetical protein
MVSVSTQLSHSFYVLVTISSKYQSPAAAVAIIPLDMHPVTYKATGAMTSSNSALGVSRFAGSAAFSDHDKNGNKVFEDSRNNLEFPVPIIVADHDLILAGICSNHPFECIVCGNDDCVIEMKKGFSTFLLEQPKISIELTLDEKRSLSEQSPLLTVKDFAAVLEYLVVFDETTSKASFRSVAQRIPNDFSMFTNVTSFLGQDDVDAVNLRKLNRSGFNGYLAIASSFVTHTDNNTLSAEFSTLDASSGSNITVAADASNLYRLAMCPRVGIPAGTDCAVDKVCKVQHQISFALFHQAVPPSMVHALVAFGATLVISYLCKRKRMKSKGLVITPSGRQRFFGQRKISPFLEAVDHWASLYGQMKWFEGIPRGDVAALKETKEYKSFISAFQLLEKAHRIVVTSETAVSLERISDDGVVLRICEFLHCHDLVVLSGTCSRFHSLCNMSAKQRTSHMNGKFYLDSYMMLLRAKEQAEGVKPESVSVRVPLLSLQGRIVVTNAGDEDYNGIYHCTGTNANGFLFSKPRFHQRHQTIRRIMDHEMNRYAGTTVNEEIFPDGNSDRPLRCVICKRFSHSSILWYMSKEVETEDGAVRQEFSFWANLMASGMGTSDMFRYPSQTSVFSIDGHEAWFPLSPNQTMQSPIVELLV